VVGNSLNNIIIGTTADNSLKGEGDDTLNGGLGIDDLTVELIPILWTVYR